MWNPDIDFISIQGCGACYVSPITLSLIYPEQVAKIRNIVLYTEECLQPCFEDLCDAGYPFGMHRNLLQEFRIDIIKLVTIYFRQLEIVCFTMESPGHWPYHPPHRRADPALIFDRKFKIGEKASGDVNIYACYLSHQYDLP
jgi:hypothetical protein